MHEVEPLSGLPDTFINTLEYLAQSKDLKSWSSYEESGCVTLTLKWRPKSSDDTHGNNSGFTPARYKKLSQKQLDRDNRRKSIWKEKNSQSNLSEVSEKSSQNIEHLSHVDREQSCLVIDHSSISSELPLKHDIVSKDSKTSLLSSTPSNKLSTKLSAVCVKPIPSKTLSNEDKVKKRLAKWKYTDRKGRKWSPKCISCNTWIYADVKFHHCPRCLEDENIRIDICDKCYSKKVMHHQHRDLIKNGIYPAFDPYDFIIDNT